jgi:transketolase
VDKWKAFGWTTLRCDGNDMGSLVAALETRKAANNPGTPWVIVCDTVKGKGVSFMEDVVEWHGGSLDEALRDRALAELEERMPSAPAAGVGTLGLGA